MNPEAVVEDVGAACVMNDFDDCPTQPACPADLNAHGAVNAADPITMRSSWRAPAEEGGLRAFVRRDSQRISMVRTPPHHRSCSGALGHHLHIQRSADATPLAPRDAPTSGMRAADVCVREARDADTIAAMARSNSVSKASKRTRAAKTPTMAKATTAKAASVASRGAKVSGRRRGKACTTTPDAYFAALPADRRPVMLALRAAIAKSLPRGFEEVVSYGMPGWVVPLTAYPAGYHCTPGAPLPFLGLASQKSHISFYHMGLYADPALLAWFKAEWVKRLTKKLDMGKSCVRFKKPEDVPVELLSDLCRRMTPKQWVVLYESKLRR